MILLDVVLVVLACAMAVVIGRLVRGPTDADRAAALDLGFFVFLAALAVLAARLDAPDLLDLVLTGTLVSFLATVAMARLVHRGRR
ncbi:monovalent cation/H+ antiporter complex subunit F [Micromonospora craniellae]|uniref:Pesticidal protein Cry26Aa n=1 Tax=Micromonospora craniellae TaxID=2294034 RepID=A0A372G3R1_9ACTN|nr:monovalent cation/H+ antiporter complex subunit F [Micromonospora craniellae]QOC91069.1 pesticidal protein Cry26Aa [Micromonospora craniellae]RFS47360.1 pesticidal protein Cry26Aa [Micromonospora craniellae]